MKNKGNEHIVVCKCFLRVIKNKGLYYQFIKDFEKFKIPREESNFEKGDLIKTMNYIKSLSEREYLQHRRNPNDKYEHIVFLVNTMLRLFLERTCSEKNLDISLIGKEIFEMSCKIIFGDEFIHDMEKMEQNAVSNQDDVLKDMYKKLIEKGVINGIMPFELFKEIYSKHLKQNFA